MQALLDLREKEFPQDYEPKLLSVNFPSFHVDGSSGPWASQQEFSLTPQVSFRAVAGWNVCRLCRTPQP